MGALSAAMRVARAWRPSGGPGGVRGLHYPARRQLHWQVDQAPKLGALECPCQWSARKAARPKAIVHIASDAGFWSSPTTAHWVPSHRSTSQSLRYLHMPAGIRAGAPGCRGRVRVRTDPAFTCAAKRYRSNGAGQYYRTPTNQYPQYPAVASALPTDRIPPARRAKPTRDETEKNTRAAAAKQLGRKRAEPSRADEAVLVHCSGVLRLGRRTCGTRTRTRATTAPAESIESPAQYPYVSVQRQRRHAM